MKKIEFNKTFFIRLIAIVLIIVLGIVMYWVGRQHSLLIDNKNIEIDGVTYSAKQLIEVKVDNQEVKELSKRDRIETLVLSQNHKITVTDVMGGQTIEVKFKIPAGYDMMLLSIPALLAGLPMEKCLTHFVISTTTVATPEDAEVPAIDDATSILGDF